MRTQIGSIREGEVYVFQSAIPPGRQGHHYRVLRTDVLDLPVGAKKVLMECLTGPDAGLWFCVTPANFATRYAAAPADPLPEPKEAGYAAEEWRVGV